MFVVSLDCQSCMLIFRQPLSRSFRRTISMAQDGLKRRVAEAALSHLLPSLTPSSILGVGTGSTANYFIDALGAHAGRFRAAVASSEASALRLRDRGIEVMDLNAALALSPALPFYVDGADEVNPQFELIKGGGGALTREKIVAAASTSFLCIVDGSKCVSLLGKFPLPVEVIPMAQPLVAQKLSELGGRPVLRTGFTTDNGNIILDVHGLTIDDAVALERRINNITGVVTVGLFAMRPADVLFVGTADGVEVNERARQ